VGESPNVGSPPAIVNAVIDALHEMHGVDHLDMPCTPARVWAAMQGHPEPPQ
jgi:carbon-monoxide dehydrogenase large subunit